MPHNLEWAGLGPAQSPGRTEGMDSGALEGRGQSVRRWADAAAPGTEACCSLWKWCPLELCSMALRLWASACGEVIIDSWPKGGKRTSPSREWPFSCSAVFKRRPSQRQGMEENQSKVFGARSRSDSCLRTGFLNVPGLSKARGVSSNNSLSSCIIILHLKKNSEEVYGFVAFSRPMLTTDCGSRMGG